ncbi:MAG: Short C-terminal protein [Acidimicrobiales bacterium]|nr:Short C-terminal protein [Acidimicrobiales bacterium]
MFDERRIRKHGLPGQATVVSATVHSHLSSNDYRRYDFVLDVRPAAGEPFRVEMHESFAILGLRPNEYDVVNVKYDPESHETIFDFAGDPRFDIDAMRARTAELRKETAELKAAHAAGGGMPMFQFPQGAISFGSPTAAAPTADPVAEIERLVALRDSGALTAAEFDAMKAKLIGPT